MKKALLWWAALSRPCKKRVNNMKKITKINILILLIILGASGFVYAVFWGMIQAPDDVTRNPVFEVADGTPLNTVVTFQTAQLSSTSGLVPGGQTGNIPANGSVAFMDVTFRFLWVCVNPTNPRANGTVGNVGIQYNITIGPSNNRRVIPRYNHANLPGNFNNVAQIEVTNVSTTAVLGQGINMHNGQPYNGSITFRVTLFEPTNFADYLFMTAAATGIINIWLLIDIVPVV
jgi:hypothetical protein